MQKDLAASVQVQNFVVAPTAVTTSLTSPLATVSYMTYGPVYGDYDLAFEYSMDGGLTFTEGTPEMPSELMGLTLTPYGDKGSFSWEIETDLETDRFNMDITVRTQLIGERHVSTWSYLSFLVPRVTTDVSQSYGKSSLPKDFVGASQNTKGLKKEVF